MWFLGPTWVHIPNGISIGSAVLVMSNSQTHTDHGTLITPGCIWACNVALKLTELRSGKYKQLCHTWYAPHCTENVCVFGMWLNRGGGAANAWTGVDSRPSCCQYRHWHQHAIVMQSMIAALTLQSTSIQMSRCFSGYFLCSRTVGWYHRKPLKTASWMWKTNSVILSELCVL